METFEIPDNEAGEHARRLTSLAESWGDRETARKLDWTYRVKKDLGANLKWRSEREREVFESEQKRKFAAYEGYISSEKRRGL